MSIDHPAVVPATDPVMGRVTDEPVLCPKCNRKVAWKATRPYAIDCRHCKITVER